MKKSVRPRKLVAPKANRQGFMAGVAALEWPPLGAQWDVHNSHLHHCASCLVGNRHRAPGLKDCLRDLVR